MSRKCLPTSYSVLGLRLFLFSSLPVWQIDKLLKFSTYPTIYNLMSYNEDYNEQPIYEIDCAYPADSVSDNALHHMYRSYL